MKNEAKRMAVALLAVSLIIVQSAFACTIFTASSGDKVMFAGNEDQKPNSSFLVVDNSGKLGVVYFATPWQGSPLIRMMGINEKGLCYDSNWIPPEKLNPHPEGMSQSQWPVPQLLKEAATVEEVLSTIFEYNWGDSIDHQIHFADSSGDAAVVHPGLDGELTYLRKPKGDGHFVSTNFNLAKLEEGNWSCLRYKTADEMLSRIGPKNELTVEFLASVLDATHQAAEFNTLYSAIYDLVNLQIYLYYDSQFDSPCVLDVKKELAKTPTYRKVAISDVVAETKLAAFRYDGKPSFSITFPAGSQRIQTDAPDQVFAARTKEGVTFQAAVNDIWPESTLNQWAQAYADTIVSQGIARNPKITVNTETTLACGTKAYKSEIQWLHIPSGSRPLTQAMAAFKDGETVFITAHPTANPEAVTSIVESLRFGAELPSRARLPRAIVPDRVTTFKYDGWPSFTIRLPENSIRIPLDSPEQVFAARTIDGVPFSASVVDIRPGLTLDRWPEEYVASVVSRGIGRDARITSNAEITLKDGTQAYRSEVQWLHVPSNARLLTQMVAAAKYGKLVFVVAHPAANPERVHPIVESLRFD